MDRNKILAPASPGREKINKFEGNRSSSLLPIRLEKVMKGPDSRDKKNMPENCYRWNSTEYAKHSSEQFKWAQELAAKLHLLGNEAVLDIGCGDGRATLAIAGRVPQGHVLGIDNSESMIALARQRLSETTGRNVSFRLMDATSLTFKNRFDIVFSNAALHWIKNHLPVLEGIKKSLRDSGRLLIQMGGKGNADDLIQVLENALQSERWQAYFQDFTFPYGFYGPEEYEQWLKQVGFRPQRLEFVHKIMKQKGIEGLAGWIRTTWLPYTERIPEHLKETFISEVVDAYVKAFPLDDAGYVHIRMIRLEVEAVKDLPQTV